MGGLEGLRRLEATRGQAGRKALRARLVGSHEGMGWQEGSEGRGRWQRVTGPFVTCRDAGSVQTMGVQQRVTGPFVTSVI